MAIVHLVCLLARHEWKHGSQVPSLYLLSIPCFIFVKIIILEISSNWVWMKLIWKDSIIIISSKVEILQVQRSFKWKDFIIISSSQGQMEWSLSWKFLTPSSNLFMSRNHISLSSSSLWKAFRNLFNISFIPFQIHMFQFLSKLISWWKMESIYFGIHQILPREEVVNFSLFFVGLWRLVGLVFYTDQTGMTGL
jgi:hypothetical protein